jgi:hypothetical protein
MGSACDARGRDKQCNTLVRKSERKRTLGGMTILKWTSGKGSMRMWTEFIYLRIWSIGGTLYAEKWTFDFRKKRRFWLAKLTLHSESELRFVQSICQLQKRLPMCHLNIGTIIKCSQSINTDNVCSPYGNTDYMGPTAWLNVGANTYSYRSVLFFNLLVYLCPFN